MLATTIKELGDEWESHLAKVCFAYNTSVHKSTGFSLFYLLYGRQARIPIDLVYNTPNQSHGEYARKLCQSLEKAYSSAREKLQTAAQCQKTNYDQRIHGKPFKIGDLVYLHNSVIPKDRSKKFHCPWTGPFTIIKKISGNVYRIQDTRNKKKRQVIHFDRLKQCHHKTRIPNKDTITRNDSKLTNITKSTRPSPPGTTIQLIDDEDDDTLLPQTLAEGPQLTPPRRYPLRASHRRPARYSDD